MLFANITTPDNSTGSTLMKIKAVLFDLDETVLDRSKTLEYYLAWQSNEQLSLPPEECEKYTQRFIELDDNGQVHKEEVYAALVKELGIQDYTSLELTQTYTEFLRRFTVEKRHITESISVLKSQGIKIGLISNGQSPFQEENLESLGLTEFFDTILVSESVGLRKPDIKIFELACNNLDVDPAECIFVGDNPLTDIEGANNAGMISVFVPTRRYPGCAIANHVCRDMRDLPSVVLEAGVAIDTGQ